MAHSKVIMPWVKGMLAVLQAHYPERLHVAVLYPINWVYNMAWKVAQYFFDAHTASKLNLLGDVKDHQKYIPPDQLYAEAPAPSPPAPPLFFHRPIGR
jgi:hypothetical protein